MHSPHITHDFFYPVPKLRNRMTEISLELVETRIFKKMRAQRFKICEATTQVLQDCVRNFGLGQRKPLIFVWVAGS